VPPAKPRLRATPRLRPLGPHSRTERAVLKAAADLLVAKGAAAVTIEKIAARAKVAKTTVYRWWPSKIAIFMDVFEQLAPKRLIRFPDQGSLEADLRHVLRGLLRLLRTTAAGSALAGMITEAQLDPQAAASFREAFIARGRVLGRRAFDRAKRRGELPAGFDAEVAIDMLSGAIWYRLLLGHAPLDDSYADSIVRVVAAGIRSAPESGARARLALGSSS
jgi:AcrR family transcriptional regulator